MGFDVWLADDPELEDDELTSDLPCFTVNRHVMWEIRVEMQAQGMLEFVPVELLSWNQGDHVSTDQIAAALAVAREQPATIEGADGVEIWQAWLKFLCLSLEHGGIVVW